MPSNDLFNGVVGATVQQVEGAYVLIRLSTALQVPYLKLGRIPLRAARYNPKLDESRRMYEHTIGGKAQPVPLTQPFEVVIGGI
jgi:hypothetical protein